MERADYQASLLSEGRLLNEGQQKIKADRAHDRAVESIAQFHALAAMLPTAVTPAAKSQNITLSKAITRYCDDASESLTEAKEATLVVLTLLMSGSEVADLVRSSGGRFLYDLEDRIKSLREIEKLIEDFEPFRFGWHCGKYNGASVRVTEVTEEAM